MSGLLEPRPAVEPIRPRSPRLQLRSGGIVGSRASTIVWTLLPATLVMFLFLFIPGLLGLQLSFSDWPGVGPVNFIGAENYADVFADSVFWNSVRITLFVATASSAGIVAIATLLAAAVSARSPGYRFYRVVWFLPGVAPIAAAAVFWSTAFQPGQGVVNVIMGALGLGTDSAWLASEDTVLYPLIFVTVWASVGFAFILILGAMEQIPVSVYEAARIDGASTVRLFFSMTLPLATPVIIIVSLLQFIWNFNGFTVIYAMTKGGPGFSSSTLPVLVYLEAFLKLEFGRASAMAILSGLLLFVVGVLALRLSRTKQ